MKPDLREANRLFHRGMHLVRLHDYSKRPVGDGWNDPKHRLAQFDETATGYGLPLAINNLCSIDPDNWTLAVIGMRALGMDLPALMEQGVRTKSTRTGSGGRAAFAAEGEISWLRFSSKATGVVLEFRAESANLQDVIPGLIYHDKDGRACTQEYSNGKRLDDAPAIPDALYEWWEKCSTDIEFLHEQEAMFFNAIFEYIGVQDGEVYLASSTGKSGKKHLAFGSPYRRPYNEKHSVEDILDRHPDHFVRVRGLRNRWTHPGATGAPGIRPIPGTEDLWESDHAGSKLKGTFDAWTAHVMLDFDGNKEAAEMAWEDVYGFDDSPFGAIEAPVSVSEAVQEDSGVEGIEYSLSALEPIEFVLDGFIRSGLTVIAGAPGVGKTSILVPLCAAVANLYDSGLPITLRRRVIYLSEAPEQVVMTLFGLQKKVMSARTWEFQEWFRVLPSKRVPPAVMARKIRKMVEAHTITGPNGYEVAPLIVLDTSNANIDLASENDNSEVGKAVAAIKENLGKAACWLIAHTPKTLKRADVTQLSARGASAFEGDANATAFIFKDSDDESDPRRFMRIEKHRFEAEYKELEFASMTDSEEVLTPWGGFQQIKYRVATPSISNPAARIAEKERKKREEAEERHDHLLDAIVDFVDSQPNQMASKNQIEKAVEGKTDIKRLAISELISDGRLVESDEKGRGGARLLKLPGIEF